MGDGSGRCWLTVPTHTHPPTLDDLIAAAGVPVVVVRTAPGRDVPGAVCVDDFGPPNIHRWWNTGLDEIARHGGRVAVVANHDVLADRFGEVARFAQRLDESGATLARVHSQDTAPDLSWDGRRTLTGWCFGINLTHGLRPNEAFRWWFGDDWLDATARLHHRGVIGVTAGLRHRRENGTLYPHDFGPVVAADRRLWESEKRRLLAGLTTHRARGDLLALRPGGDH